MPAKSETAVSAKKGSTIPYRETISIVDEKPRGSTPMESQGAAPVVQGVDLSGRPKIIMAAGRGRTGKTTLLRWITERAIRDDAVLSMADLDQTNPTFASYFNGAARPRNLGAFIEFTVANGASAIIDLGGGDTALPALVDEMPKVHEAIEAAGYAVAMFYVVGPSPDDLAPMINLAARGFLPPARAIVLNEGLSPSGAAREQAYARVTGSADYRDQIEAGAVPVWMPRLFAADRVEMLRCEFAEARDGISADGHTLNIGLFDRHRVFHWLGLMENQFAGVKSWLP
jgi:hypothetical protein